MNEKTKELCLRTTFHASHNENNQHTQISVSPPYHLYAKCRHKSHIFNLLVAKITKNLPSDAKQ